MNSKKTISVFATAFILSMVVVFSSARIALAVGALTVTPDTFVEGTDSINLNLNYAHDLSFDIIFYGIDGNKTSKVTIGENGWYQCGGTDCWDKTVNTLLNNTTLGTFHALTFTHGNYLTAQNYTYENALPLSQSDTIITLDTPPAPSGDVDLTSALTTTAQAGSDNKSNILLMILGVGFIVFVIAISKSAIALTIRKIRWAIKGENRYEIPTNAGLKRMAEKGYVYKFYTDKKPRFEKWDGSI